MKSKLTKEKLSGSWIDLMYCEYDRGKHICICKSENNIFDLPRVMTDFPDSLRKYDIIHPDDRTMFVETLIKMKESSRECCEIRIKKGEYYRWYACMLENGGEADNNNLITRILFVDISERKQLVHGYESYLQKIFTDKNCTISMATVDLTHNTYERIHAIPELEEIINTVSNLDELFMRISETVVGEKEQEEYRKIFNREHLIECVKQGKCHMEYVHQQYMKEDIIWWLNGNIDLFEDPQTHDIIGAYYGKCIHDSYMKNLILEKLLSEDYIMSAVTNKLTEKYNLIYHKAKKLGETNNDFWGMIAVVLHSFCLMYTQEEILEIVSKQRVLKELDQNRTYSFIFDANDKGKRARFKIVFYYLDDTNDYILTAIRDVSDNKLIEKLCYENEHDSLTNLYNRNKVFKKCREILNLHPQQKFAMIYFDLRRFHQYNTFFGENEGDELLRAVAKLLRSMDSDYEYWSYGRVNADVFLILIPVDNNHYHKNIHRMAFELEGYRDDFPIEVSLGIYLIKDITMPIDAMFVRAQTAAKENRLDMKKRVFYYTKEMDVVLGDRKLVVNEMQAALLQEQFKVYLQPKYSLITNKIIGSEALVRWEHPVYGTLSPAKFIPVYEQNGYIAKLDRYMWEHVCILLRRWKEEGKTIFPISVNVSRVSMYDRTAVQFIQNLIEKYQIDPNYLELELTESAYMDEPEQMKERLYELQSYGFKILMDDFGNGYSSLNTLREVPVDILKLDMKFLAKEENKRGAIILMTILQMSKALNLPVVAEGVETQKQADFLQSIGCQYVQGYLYARPMPVDEYEKLL